MLPELAGAPKFTERGQHIAGLGQGERGDEAGLGTKLDKADQHDEHDHHAAQGPTRDLGALGRSVFVHVGIACVSAVCRQ